MRTTRRHRTAGLALIALLASGAVQGADTTLTLAGHPPVRVHGPLPVARSIIDAEFAFEKRAETAGPAVAMREMMDPVDGLGFAGGEPARGAAALFAAYGGLHSGTLSWTPAELFADQAGEMGATWGHFRFVPPGPSPRPVTGRYVTVWRKTDAGWRGIIDIGSPD